jgi:hypothetical protein
MKKSERQKIQGFSTRTRLAGSENMDGSNTDLIPS